MIDFGSSVIFKLEMVDNDTYRDKVEPLFVDGESIISTYKGLRDGIVFTTKRIIAINVQGISGKKVDYTSLPYKTIQAYSIETAGSVDLDNELDLWFAGVGTVRFQFARDVDISYVGQTIAEFMFS